MVVVVGIIDGWEGERGEGDGDGWGTTAAGRKV
jgi:hypothetical protein